MNIIAMLVLLASLSQKDAAYVQKRFILEPTLTSTESPAIECKTNGYIYDPLTQLCLKFFENPKLNLTGAMTHCNSTKGELAFFPSPKNVDDVMALFGSRGVPLWVGVTDLGLVRQMTLIGGSKVKFNTLEFDLSNHYCMYVARDSHAGFDPCSDTYGFICEKH